MDVGDMLKAARLYAVCALVGWANYLYVCALCVCVGVS